MTSLRVLGSRLLDVILRRRRDERLNDEIQGHLDLLTEEYVARGMPPDEARRAAHRAFGGVEQLKEVYRDQRGLPGLDTIRQDISFGLRLLRRDPGFALTALFVLTVGIGVNNMLFTILNAHTLRGLPMPAAQRVASVSTIDVRNQPRGFSHPDFADGLRSIRSFEHLLAMASAPVVIAGDGHSAERIEAAYFEGNPFAIAGGQPVRGRGFTPADERPGAPLVVLITTALWQNRYAGDPAVLGRTLNLDGSPATIAGVVDARSGLPTTAAIWLPLSQLPGIATVKRSDRNLRVFGRLRENATFETVAAEIDGVMARLEQDHPETNAKVRATVAPINEQYFGRWTDPVWFRFMTVGFFVLLISCANVANLMLARGIARTRELAVRSSLGASRWRLVRQLLVEGIVLAAIGGVLGLGFGMAGVRILRAAIPENALPYWLDYSPDTRVIAMLIAVSLGAVLVFALLPAMRSSRTDINRVLKDGGRSGPGGQVSRRWTTAFLTAEFALAVLLLAQLAVVLRSSSPGLPSDDAINTRTVVTAAVTLAGPRYASPEQRAVFYTMLRERLREVAGVVSMSVTTAPPFAQPGEVALVGVSRPFDGRAEPPMIRTVAIAPAYFETLGLALVRGHDFVEGGTTADRSPAIVNQEFTRRFLSASDPIGERIAVARAGDPQPTPAWLTIRGVAPDVRQGAGSGEPVIYTPYLAEPSPTATLLVRGHDDATRLVGQIKEQVAALDPGLPLYRVQTIADAIWAARWNGRLSHRMFLTLTLIASLLSTIGLYAVTMHGIRQRTHEIGLRIALGARPVHVIAMVMRRAFVQLGFGFLAGVVCTRLWASGSPPGGDGVSATDPQSLAIVAGVLVLLAGIACAAPVLRAARLDPVASIRHE